MPRPETARRAILTLVGVVTLLLPCRADTWTDPHDDPSSAWTLAPSNGARLVSTRRERTEATDGRPSEGVERITYRAPPAYAAQVWRSVPPAAVIDELTLSATVWLPLPGAQLVAEVVLPKSQGDVGPDDPGSPRRLVVRLDRARPAPPGKQTFRLEDVPALLRRQAQVWRLKNRKETLDLRGAYVQRIGLILPGTGRDATALVYEVRIESLVTPLRTVATVAQADVAADPDANDDQGKFEPTGVTLRSDGFRVDDKPFFPRIWRWRGEPFETLARQGVNTVWLDDLPTAQQRAEAAELKLRIICPPPESARFNAGDGWSRVIAWSLPGVQGAAEIDTALAEAERLRAFAPASRRPLLANVQQGADAWARIVDGLLLPPGDASGASALPPGVPVIRLAPVELGPQAIQQVDALLGEGVASAWLTPAVVAGHVESAVRDGAIGIAYFGSSSLDGADDATIAAAGWISTLNRRLRLIEPWLLGPRGPTPPNGETESAALLSRGPVQLAAFPPLREAAANEEPPVLLRGVAPSTLVYRLTPCGMADWSGRRSQVGVAVETPSTDLPGDLLVTGDPRVIRSLQAYIAKTAPRAAEGLLRVAEWNLHATESLTTEQRESARQQVADARLAIARRDPLAAYDAAYACLAEIATADRRRLRTVNVRVANSSPLALSPGTLTDLVRLEQILATSPRGPNRLHGGSFEDIDDLRRHGWRHPGEAATTAESPGVELLTGDPVHGERFVRLASAGATIHSPPIELEPGAMIEVTGWARIDADRGGGALRISDSLGGPELAIAMEPTANEWRPFRLLRSATDATELVLTLRAEGAAVADVDAIMIRDVRPTGTARAGGPAQLK